MKGLIFGGVSTLLVAIAGVSAVSPAFARPVVESAESASPIGDNSVMTFNFTAPFITNSGVRGSAHFIRLAVVGMAVEDLMISLPSQMERYDKIVVLDQNSREIPAKVTVTNNQAAIVFNQAVVPGSYVEVKFTGVEMRGSGGDTLFYGVTAQRRGLRGEIPVGTARVQVPSRS